MESRDRLLAACRCQKLDRPPVWLMRQAGRYLPEYRALRQKRSFWDLMRTPALAVEVSLQPLGRFEMDAAILFSDILVVLDAMGVRVRYENGGPQIEHLVRKLADLGRLEPVRVERALDYVGEATQNLCQRLHPQIGVIGFAGAPFTLAAYLIEGGPARQLHRLKSLAYREPELFDEIASRITEVVTDLLELQIRAGADMVQVFDTWAWHLCPDDYERLALPYTRRVIERLAGHRAPIALYLRNAAGHLRAAGASGCQVLSVDTSLRLTEARDRVERNVALQGNFDPALLFARPERIHRDVQQAIESMRGRGYIVNLGQGLCPDTPVEGVAAFVQAVRGWSA